jgi:hypothetical protein
MATSTVHCKHAYAGTQILGVFTNAHRRMGRSLSFVVLRSALIRRTTAPMVGRSRVVHSIPENCVVIDKMHGAT